MNKHIQHDIVEHVAMPHPTELLGYEGNNEVVQPFQIDPIFTNSKGEPDPIRASEERTQIGTLNFLAGNATMELPVDEIRMTGLENENRVRQQIEQVRESDPFHYHIILVSQMAYAALRLANIPTRISQENPVGFGIPAGIERDDEGNILYAKRVDQPTPTNLKPWNQGEARVASRREQLLNARDFELSARNFTPSNLYIGNSFLRRGAVTQPEYNSQTVVGHTSVGTPITIPKLVQLWGEDHHANVQLVHPRALPIARQLGRADIVAKAFMPSPERLPNGSFSHKVGRLAVFHADTLNKLASYAA
jgi:hypothetical protein